MEEILKNAFFELCDNKFQFVIEGRIPTYKISRTKKGKWFINTIRGFHTEEKRIYIDINNFPNLRKLLRNLEALDAELSIDGGRISLSPKVIKSKNVNLLQAEIRLADITSRKNAM